MILSLLALGLWLLQSALGGGLLLLLTVGLMTWARQPALKQRLGEWGLAAALAVCLLSLLPAWFVLPWNVANLLSPPEVGNASPVSREVTPIVPAKPVEVPAPLPAPALAEVAPAPPAELVFVPKEAPVAEEVPAPAPDASSANLWAPVLGVLVGVYVLGLALLLVRLGLAFVALRRLVRRSHPATGALQQLLAELAPDGSAPRLLLSAHLHVPISFGLLRPTIVLPAQLSAQLDRARLRWVLAHELTHLRRRDSWSGLLCALAQALFFYLPWSWSISRQIRLCQEFIADAAAVPADRGPDYAEFLLTLTRAPALPLVAASVSGKASDLFRRISMLLERPIAVERTCSRRVLLCGAAALLALAVLVSGVSLAGGERPVIIILGGPGEAKEAKSPPPAPGAVAVPGQGERHQKIKVYVLQDGKLISGGKEAAPRGDLLNELGLKELGIEVRRLHGQQAGKEHIQVIVIKDGKVLARPVGAMEIVPQHLQVVPGKRVAPPAKQEGAGGKEETRELRFWVEKPARETKVKILQNKVEMKGGGAGQTTTGQKYFYVPGIPGTPGARQEGTLQPLILNWVVDQKSVDHKELEEALKKLEKVLDKAEVAKVRQEIHKALQAAERARAVKHYEEALKLAPSAQAYRYTVTATPDHYRLGVSVKEPEPALVDQLNLPKGQGIVILNVLPGSPAEKAGLKPSDVLLEIGGQPVPSEPHAFVKTTSGLRAGKSVAIVVIRKGHKQTIHDVQLRDVLRTGEYYLQTVPGKADPAFYFRYGAPAAPKAPALPVLAKPQGAASKSVMLTVLRTEDRFTARHQEGSLVITVTGHTAGGKAHAGEINIQDGSQTSKYQRVQDVPAQYRDKVEQIVDLVRRGNLQIQTK